VIVADNGSTDLSPRVAIEAGTTLLNVPGCRVSEVRNRAAATASGDIIAFVDSDHEIAPGWIAAVVDALAEPGVGAVGALCRPPANGTWVQRMYGALRGRTVGRSDVEWLGAGNMAVRKDAFASVAGFDQALETCEDVDLCQRLRAKGWRVVGDDRLDNVHLGDPATLARLFKGERWRGRDNLRVTFRGAWSVRNAFSVAIPIADALLIVAAIVALVGFPWARTESLFVAALASSLIVAGALARAGRMVRSASLSGPRLWAQAAIVAMTYDLGRAAALFTSAGHHRERGVTGARTR
jgi:cellulose synthase/poly-beta-1,6-N-acetylglucosamine synthase-like glycosyltransferase